MASEIRVDKINSLSGVGTVTLSPTGVDISGITTVSTLKVGTGLTASSDGDVFFTGIATATTFVGNLTGDPTGSGANLTALPAGQLTGTVADARISTLTASKLSGALPAISALNLTNVPAANVVGVHTSLNITGSTTTGTAVVGGGVTISESGIEASGIGITVANINGTQLGGRRNKIGNGAMRISQRGTSFASASNEYTLDRFRIQNSHDGAVTITQSTTSPDGFSNSLKVDVTTADTSIAASQYLQLAHRMEAQDLQDLAFGTSAAKSITVSFYVRSNLTGTYTFNIQQADNSSKQVSQTYTIDSADTWERKTFTFAGDTSGVINNDNTQGLVLYWNLSIGNTYTTGTSRAAWTTFTNPDFAAGHTANLLSSTSNEFYLTGVQFEIGSQATVFEHRSFAEELALCQRYCYVWKSSVAYSNMAVGYMTDANNVDVIFNLPQIMRTSPSFSNSGSFRCVGYENGSQYAQALSSFSMTRSHPHTPYLRGVISGGQGSAVGEFGDNGSNDATAIFSAEL